MRVFTIYLGTACNMSCTYCDRTYLAQQGLNQSADMEDIDRMADYLIKQNLMPDDLVCFHGGEPLLHIDSIRTVMDYILEDCPGITFFIQTNGSEVLKHKDFFEKYSDNLFVSISYDFSTQEDNRGNIPIDDILCLLMSLSIDTQLQSVIDMKSDFFESSNMLDMITLCKKYSVCQLDFITLRHIRGGSELRVVLDDMTQNDIKEYFSKMCDALLLFRLHEIDVFIDGAMNELEDNKKYSSSSESYLNILSPDGHIYSEYDFLDYRVPQYAIGSWKNGVIQNRNADPLKFSNECLECRNKDICGLQYLITIFNKDLPGNCRMFYDNVRFSHKYNKYISSPGHNALTLTKDSFEKYLNE